MESGGGRPLWQQGSTRLFTGVGGAAIVAAGLFSAGTARVATYHSAWLVAYLVLVVGVAQIALGVGQAALAAQEPSRAVVAVEFVFFLVGNIGVIVGTLAGVALAVDAGSLLLVVALASFAWSVRRSRASAVAVWGYRVFVGLMIASVIVGVVFAHNPTR